VIFPFPIDFLILEPKRSENGCSGFRIRDDTIHRRIDVGARVGTSNDIPQVHDTLDHCMGRARVYSRVFSRIPYNFGAPLIMYAMYTKYLNYLSEKIDNKFTLTLLHSRPSLLGPINHPNFYLHFGPSSMANLKLSSSDYLSLYSYLNFILKTVKTTAQNNIKQCF
jgi:hypothetical protein